MRIKRKNLNSLLIVISAVLVISIISSRPRTINISGNGIKGNIIIWTEEKYYKYFFNIANEFQENNKKVKVEVVNIKKEEYLQKILSTNKEDLPNIVHLDFKELNEIKDKLYFVNENEKIIETYNKNFNKSRVQQIKINGNYDAVPFTSNPITLFLRSDTLNSYGYRVEDIKTWSQLINIGQDINNKSNGEINLFSSEDKDNINLIITAQLVDSLDKKYSKDKVEEEIEKIYSNNFTNDSNYICRITSLSFYKELNEGKINGLWECTNPPTFNVGENRFYDIGGENLVALKINNNGEAIKSFISYAANNKEELSKELINYNFIPSSLYSLKINNAGDINNNIIQGNNPFLILINIVERAPEIKNYKEFEDVIYDIYSN